MLSYYLNLPLQIKTYVMNHFIICNEIYNISNKTWIKEFFYELNQLINNTRIKLSTCCRYPIHNLLKSIFMGTVAMEELLLLIWLLSDSALLHGISPSTKCEWLGRGLAPLMWERDHIGEKSESLPDLLKPRKYT